MPALILDLDGTVIDSHRYTFDAIRHACEPFRPPPSDDDIFAAFGPSERVILRRLIDATEVERAYERLLKAYADGAASVRLHPEMRSTLRTLRAAGIRCGLFTGRGGDSTRLLLERLDLGWAFDAVVAGDEVAHPKPAADGVVALLERLGATPVDCWLVGDSPLDVAAARAAGAPAAFAAWHAWRTVQPPPGLPILRSPSQLLALCGLPAGSDPDGSPLRAPS